MDTPQTKYAKTPDGVYIVYQTVGDGPIDRQQSKTGERNQSRDGNAT